MATENKSNSDKNNDNKNKKRRHRYLPHNKSVKKGAYPLRPGIQGFFLTCDGGRERQATHEAINVIDSFYEELVHGEDSGVKHAVVPQKSLNKIIKFSDSDSSNDDDSDDDNSGHHNENDANNENQATKNSCTHKDDGANSENQESERLDPHKEDNRNHENQADETEGTVSKKQRLETDTSKCGILSEKREEKSIDQLIEAELKELGDRNKRRFVSLDSGCNGVIFVQMHKRDGDPGPVEIVQHMMTSAASTRKHMSRFILRVIPVEVACYASEEEISKAIKPLISQYFPADAQTPYKFAVLYEARANTGIDRMTIINSVAKSVPAPHKVDLNNPEKTIIVQIVKTLCLISVVEKYKELSKYNLRQLTSPK